MSEEVIPVPKVAIRTVLEKPTSDGFDERTVYSVEKAQKAVSGSRYYTRDVIGYVELPRYTRFDRCDSFVEFLDQIESKSVFHEWFPQRLTGVEKDTFVEGGSRDE